MVRSRVLLSAIFATLGVMLAGCAATPPLPRLLPQRRSLRNQRVLLRRRFWRLWLGTSQLCRRLSAGRLGGHIGVYRGGGHRQRFGSQVSARR